MAAVFTHTETYKVIGNLTNGMKLVSTTVTVSNGGFGTDTAITIKPLKRVIGFTVIGKTPIASAFVAWAIDSALLNVINGKPVASANGGIYEILAFGY
jgi:hypothetical protein